MAFGTAILQPVDRVHGLIRVVGAGCRTGIAARCQETFPTGSAVIAASPTFTKLAFLVLGLAAYAARARAQDIVPPSASGRGAILIYGNYCGPGNRGPGYGPIDALDLACAHHDACSTDPDSGVLTSCACNRRLEVEAGRVARDQRAPIQTRQTAQFIASFATALPCQ